MPVLKSPKLIMSMLISAVLLAAGTVFLLIGPPQLLAKSESPQFCASCHVMEEQYTAWSHAGAHRRIGCNECHLPNGNVVEHYVWKSIDGMKDVLFFHSGHVAERIVLTSHGSKVVQDNCIRCHSETISQMDTTRQCWACHRQLRHRLTGVVGIN